MYAITYSIIIYYIEKKAYETTTIVVCYVLCSMTFNDTSPPFLSLHPSAHPGVGSSDRRQDTTPLSSSTYRAVGAKVQGASHH